MTLTILIFQQKVFKFLSNAEITYKILYYIIDRIVLTS